MKLSKFCKFALAFVLSLSLFASACGTPAGGTNEGDNGGGGNGGQTDDTVAVTSVELDQASLTLDIGQSKTLTCMVLPANATDKTEKWLSSAPNIAEVANGTVTGKAEGMATIRVTVGQKYAECTVKVNDPSKARVEVTAITITPATLSLEVPNAGRLTANIEPANATDQKVTWESSQPTIASVDAATGIVTAVSAGVASVTARSANGVHASCFVTVTSSQGGGGGGTQTSDALWVGKIDSLLRRSKDTPFIMAMDASAVPSLEAARAPQGLYYKNFDGEVEDVFKILKDNGITDIRVRVWNDPTDGKGNGYGGGNCDVDNAVAIARHCKEADLGLIIDFHYSDFWADPGKQTIPKAWKGHSTTQVAKDIYDFTKDSLTKIKETGAKITMVQIGNETTSGLAGTTDWAKNNATICNYINNGAKAVREVTGDRVNGGARVAVHFTNPEAGNYLSFAGYLDANKVDYDVFGSSFYPYWHGTLENLANQLTAVHNRYNKEVMCLETSYAFTLEDFDGYGDTGLDTLTQPTTVQGQSNAVRDVIKTIADLGDWGLGISYWEGTWIAASESSDGNYNRNLCTQYGCGWAAQAAHDYDSSANNGGCVIDNQAFWLSDGTPLESLKVFKLVYEGTNVSIKADSLEAQDGYYTVNEGPITLPDTVQVTLNNGTSMLVAATWNIDPAKLEEYIKVVGTYEVKGTSTYGGECIYTIWVMNPNIFNDGSFESCKSYGNVDSTVQNSQLNGWKLSGYTSTSTLQLYVSNNSQNARMGKLSFHFWDEGAITFRLFQEFTRDDLTEYGDGKYSASFDIMGGDGVNMDIYAYIKLTYTGGNTQEFKGEKVELTKWLDWHKTIVKGVTIDSSVTKIEVGIYVKAGVTGNGPWGNIDNAQFYFDEA